jgi:hypothetical protein
VHYAPYFELCAKRAYPDAVVRVDILDNVPCLYYAACYRLLNEVPGDYVYITDVDMLLMPGLFDYHTNMMAETGLPYSNCQRKNETMGADRMTGLHFCTPEWYRVTAESRRKYMANLNRGEIGGGRFDDELTLMRVVRESGLGLPPRRRLINLHFGVHIGTVRAYKHHTRETMRHQLNMRVSTSVAQEMCVIMDSPEWRDIKCDNRTVRDEMRMLEVYCRGRAKQ